MSEPKQDTADTADTEFSQKIFERVVLLHDPNFVRLSAVKIYCLDCL